METTNIGAIPVAHAWMCNMFFSPYGKSQTRTHKQTKQKQQQMITNVSIPNSCAFFELKTFGDACVHPAIFASVHKQKTHWPTENHSKRAAWCYHGHHHLHSHQQCHQQCHIKTLQLQVVPHCAVSNSFWLKVYGCLLEGILFVLLHHWVRHSAIWRTEVWTQKKPAAVTCLARA